MLCNKKLNAVVNELFIRGRKLNISLVFMTQSYFESVNKSHLIAFEFLHNMYCKTIFVFNE